MAFKVLILSVCVFGLSVANTPAPYGYTPTPVYGYSPTPAPYVHEPSYHEPAYHIEPAYHHESLPYHESASPYHPTPAYTPAPSYHAAVTPVPPHHPLPPHHHKDAHYTVPKCAHGNPTTYCLEDKEYPKYEIEKALEYHYDAVQQLYKDVLANTENSVDRLKELVQETYLCPSETKYIQPLRAVNLKGVWRIVVNNVKAHYETLTQTARVEHCSTPGDACPLVPECYETKCLQKSVYHRFLIYDPYDQYLPFAIESFKLPSSCACYNGAFAEKH